MKDSKQTQPHETNKAQDYKLKQLAQVLGSSHSEGMTRLYMAFSDVKRPNKGS